MTPKELKARITRDIEETEARVATVVREIELFISSYMERFLDDLEDGEVDPIAALGSLMNAIKSAGLDERLAKVGELYGKELRKAQQVLRENGIDPLVNISEDTIAALIQFKVEQLEGIALRAVGDVRPILLQNIITGERFDPQSIIGRLNAPIHQIETELRTAMMAFNRTITQVQAEAAGVERFIYVGPDDKLTRPFCEHVLNDRDPPIYTLEEIDAMDNEQGLDVHQYGGGYNCRHTWQPVSDEMARILGDES